MHLRIRQVAAVGIGCFMLASLTLADGNAAGEPEKPTTHPPEHKHTVAALCPVTTKPIDKAHWVSFRGKRVYFADAASKAKFEDDPYAYVEGIQKQWEALKPLRVQVRCPVTGKPVDTTIFLDQDHETVYFATAEAKAAWQKSPKAYREKLAACYTFQTTCPCQHGDVRPDVSDEIRGQTVYYCCPGCRKMFEKRSALALQTVKKQITRNEAAWERREAATASKKKGEKTAKAGDDDDKAAEKAGKRK